MSKKKIIIAAIALVVAVAILAVVYIATRPETEAGEKTFTVTVVHGDGKEATFTYTTEKEYVGQVLQEEGLVVGYQGEFGLFMEAVDGETAPADYSFYWAFYEGDQYAQFGIDQTPVRDGAAYRLVYEDASLAFAE